MPTTTHVELRRFTRELLTTVEVSDDCATLISDSLVDANLKGVDSHGVQLLPVYMERLAKGDICAKTTGSTLLETGSCCMFDGENGMGQTIAASCADRAAALAGATGIGMVVARNSNHFGRAGFWAKRIAAAQCIAIVVSNASPLMAPWQGRHPSLGTNPISIAVPGPWILDMASSAAAMGKIIEAALAGRTSIPQDWALDAGGNPVTSTAAALAGTLMPLGGSVAGYKGSGLAFAVELLTGVLGGGNVGPEVGSLRAGRGAAGVSHTFIAIEIRRFLPPVQFEKRLSDFLQSMKASPPAPGFEEVLMAGEMEERTSVERSSKGIPIPQLLWKQLSGVAVQRSIPPLQPLEVKPGFR